MKLITRDTDYALRALCFIGKRRDQIVSASELVRELRIPRPFLRKILQMLNKKGILNSYKGQSGGFSLRRPPSKIFLLEVIEIFQGRLNLNECMFKKRICPNRKTCLLKKRISDIEKFAYLKLKSTNKFAGSVKAVGGGISGQAEAVRHGISRALILFDVNFRKKLKKAGFLKRDPREKERRKFGLKKARRAPQWSKR